MNKQKTIDQQIVSWKIYSKTHKFIFKSIHVTLTGSWIGSHIISKIGWIHGKNLTLSLSQTERTSQFFL